MATQEEFLIEARKGKNIFLTWKAWTWKSYIIQQYIEEIWRKNVVITSSTWISALNIKWATYHSVFKIFWLQYNNPVPKTMIQWNMFKLLLIDEISMVWPDSIDQIDKDLRVYLWRDEPFWWMQVIFIWDKQQLQPVYSANTAIDAEIIQWFKNKYWALTFDNADAYKQFQEIELDKVYRQDDWKFVDILNMVREWNTDEALKHIKTDIPKEAWFDSTHIMPYNNMVDAHNKKALASIKWEEKIYRWHVSSWFNQKNCITPIDLHLKVWALVMVTANLTPELKNWTTWTVVWFKKWSVTIKVWKHTHWIMINEWEQKWYWTQWLMTLWTFHQIPLKLAWACTIHKTQWLTLDKVIFHNVWNISNNEIYVWLSRATSLDNLYIKHY